MPATEPRIEMHGDCWLYSEAVGIELEITMAEYMARKLADGKAVPPGKYPLYAAAVREPIEAFVEIVWYTHGGPKAGEYMVDTFDLRNDKDARRFASLLAAAGLPPGAPPADLLAKTVVASVRCIGDRKQNDVTEYKRDPRA